MRYVIYGAGAIGGAIGVRLAQHGRHVVLIARGAHLQAIHTGGLELRDPDGSVRLPIPAVARPGELDLKAGDVVVLAMKSQHTDQALDELAALGVAGIVVCCAQNGVQNERTAARRFADVLGVHVMVPALHLEPGVIELSSGPVGGRLGVGRYPAGRDGVTDAVATDLQASGFDSEPVPDIMRWKYGKLLSNLGNVVEAAAGQAWDDPVVREIDASARAEGITCLDAAGISWANLPGESLPEVRPVNHRMRPGGSTWQSLSRGGASLESDYLNGEIVLLGRLHGVATPVNAALQQLAWWMVREQLAPGSVTVEALTRWLGPALRGAV